MLSKLKRYMVLGAGAAFAALVLSLSVANFSPAWARVVGTWEYPSFITLSTQIETHGAPATFNGAVTFTSSATFAVPIQQQSVSSTTLFSLIATSTGSQVWNTTYNAPCWSTGTTATNQWVFATTSTATAPLNCP